MGCYWFPTRLRVDGHHPLGFGPLQSTSLPAPPAASPGGSHGSGLHGFPDVWWTAPTACSLSAGQTRHRRSSWSWPRPTSPGEAVWVSPGGFCVVRVPGVAARAPSQGRRRGRPAWDPRVPPSGPA